ncbi:MAG: hypothetical protein WCF67_07095 [Chitinophagaceae bacterium]
MGKDRSAKYHPPKGKPSGAGKEEGLGLHPTEPDKLDQYMDISDKYTTGEDELAPGVPVRHPNRNTEKGHDRFKNQQDAQDSRKSDDLTYNEERTNVKPQELSHRLNKELFADLANHKGTPCISVYLPTHASGVDVNELADQREFKHLLNEIKSALKSKGHNNASIEKLLEPGQELLIDETFWRKQSQGLAVFISNDYFKYMKLPITPEKEILVNSSFQVAPLIPLMTAKEFFYLLVISKKTAKLFRCDTFGIEYIDVPGLPQGEDMTATLGYDKDVATTFRAGGRGGTGGANFHGAGGGNNNDDKVELTTYLETVDDVIWKEVLHAEHAPLLLAGVEYLIPIYKSVSDYKHVCEEALTGSHERDETSVLYALAMEKMVPYFQQRMHKALELYGNQSATALTTSITDDIIPAAHYGQISHLFVQKGAHVWGTFDEMANELKVNETEQENDEDLLDIAVSKTLLTGGEVFMLDKEMMPAESVMAAVLRY